MAYKYYVWVEGLLEYLRVSFEQLVHHLCGYDKIRRQAYLIPLPQIAAA
jgi:hypothetical protein